jgi:hypothetical protein
MTCFNVETIGTFTGVLAHFRYYRKGLTQRGEDAKKTGGDWEAVVGDGMAQ